jgi:hypothetical protein
MPATHFSQDMQRRLRLQRALHTVQRHIVPAQNLKRLYAMTFKGPKALMHKR